jgi:hypothetical protein
MKTLDRLVLNNCPSEWHPEVHICDPFPVPLFEKQIRAPAMAASTASTMSSLPAGGGSPVRKFAATKL